MYSGKEGLALHDGWTLAEFSPLATGKGVLLISREFIEVLQSATATPDARVSPEQFETHNPFSIRGCVRNRG